MATPTITPGVKTSEFWLTLLTILLGGSVEVGLVPEAGIISKLVALAVVTLASYGYVYQRTALKFEQ